MRTSARRLRLDRPRPRQLRGVAFLCALLCGLAAVSCGAPQHREYVEDDGVEDDAVESAVRTRPPRPNQRSRSRSRQQRSARARPATRRTGPRTSKPAPDPTASSHRARSPDAVRCANGDVDGHSVGRANDGSLDDGCELPRSGPGYVSVNAARFGARRIVGIVQYATSELARLHPSAPRVVIGALSREDGGRLKGHKSHQSGRDVDVGYLHEDGQKAHFVHTTPDSIDVARTWTLLGAMLRSGQAQYVFMDYRLQAVLYRHLERDGVDESTLGRIFQYPNGRGARRGLIRHASGHADHFHIRFRCPAEDEDCED